jgi:hypothetical protein
MARCDARVGGMAEVEKNPFENLIAGPSGWPEAYHQLQQFVGARGAILFILLAAALFVWWRDIVKRPGVGGSSDTSTALQSPSPQPDVLL